MNAAFLLMTTAWLAAGQVPPAPPPAPVAAPAACGGACGGCTDPCGCEPFGHRLREHLRGLFARDCCDSCAPTCAPRCRPAPVCCTPAPVCCKPVPVCKPVYCKPVCAPAPVCCKPAPVCTAAPACCRPKIEFHLPHLFHRDCCAPTCAPVKTCCAPACDSCGKPHFFDRIRAWWHSDDCCDSCGSSAPVTPAPGGEKIAPPAKKMPTSFENSTSIPQGPLPQSAPYIQNETPAVPVAPPGFEGRNPY